MADIYRALTYYHDQPEEMRTIERQRQSAIEEHDHVTSDPDDVRGYWDSHILADEPVEQATTNYLRKLDHGVEWIGI